MKKELFMENFNYFLKIKDQVKKYDDFMLNNFNERRDDNYSNWYENEAYEHAKKVFQLNYNDKDEWFDYFIFECLFPAVDLGPNVVTCKNKKYELKDLDSFYYFCENELEKL